MFFMLPDVQTRIPEIKLHLTRVGVKDVRKLLKIPRGEKRPIILLASINVYVDLPAQQKGTHMSRNLQGINEIIEDIVTRPVYELEDLVGDIADDIFKRHSYASRCEVELTSNLMLPSRTPEGKADQNFIKLIAKAVAERDAVEVKKEVGAEIEGLILHPHPGDSSCTQKARASLIVEAAGGVQIKILEIVDILEGSLSAKAYGTLTKDEEDQVIEKACSTPKLVDDVVSSILTEVGARFPDLPGTSRITARCLGENSLFTFNTVSEVQTTMGKIRERE